jgi:hypothetical protein
MTPQPVTEIEEGRFYLEGARDRAVAATAGLSQDQWNYRPASGGWGIAQILEHMVVVQEIVGGPIAGALAAAPETPGPDQAIVDSILKTKFTDRSRRFPSPEVSHPTSRWTPAESLDKLVSNTARLVGYLESTPGLRRHRVPAPPLRAISGGAYELMDGYQWLLALALHTDRHTEQILEVKAEPGFPRS